MSKTPLVTTKAIKSAFVTYMVASSAGWPSRVKRWASDIFDHWLATTIRNAKRRAWEEGFSAGERDVFEHGGNYDSPCIPNPYSDSKESK